jgi:hypothetical protein
MKSKTVFYYLFFAMAILAVTGCTKEGPAGKDGTDGVDGTDGIDGTNGVAGTANVMYSEWLSPTEWLGASGDYYFDVSEPAITQGVIDNGVVLAYTKLTSDATNVRPLPANTGSSTIWNYLIPAVGTIEFTTNFTAGPSLSNAFRYVIIPGGNALKSTKLSLDDLSKMSYTDVCKMFGIPE